MKRALKKDKVPLKLKDSFRIWEATNQNKEPHQRQARKADIKHK